MESVTFMIIGTGDDEMKRRCEASVSEHSGDSLLFVEPYAAKNGPVFQATPQRSDLLVDPYAAKNGPVFQATSQRSHLFVEPPTVNLSELNALAENSSDEFIVFISDRVRVTAGWMEPILGLFRQFPEVAVVQPKVMDAADPKVFSRRGGAGGFVDKLGYTYIRGAAYGNPETDSGQFDRGMSRINWCDPAIFCIRRSVFMEVRGFDPCISPNISSLDLCLRIQRSGHQIHLSSGSVVYYDEGAVGGDSQETGAVGSGFVGVGADVVGVPLKDVDVGSGSMEADSSGDDVVGGDFLEDTGVSSGSVGVATSDADGVGASLKGADIVSGSVEAADVANASLDAGVPRGHEEMNIRAEMTNRFRMLIRHHPGPLPLIMLLHFIFDAFRGLAFLLTLQFRKFYNIGHACCSVIKNLPDWLSERAVMAGSFGERPDQTTAEPVSIYWQHYGKLGETASTALAVFLVIASVFSLTMRDRR